MRAGIALGSNLGDRFAYLQSARERLVRLASTRATVLASSLYETEPVDCAGDAGKFLNGVLELETECAPLDLLGKLRAIEIALGRPARHERNASRTIDLDLLYLGDCTMSSPELKLPHPRMLQRRFVLEPLAEIRPDLILPRQTKSVAQLLADLPEQSPLWRVASEW